MPRLSLAALSARWRGVALTLIIGVTTLWLAAAGQLVLYIHPRYVVFTVVLTVIGMALALLALALSPDGDDEPGHGGEDAPAAQHDAAAAAGAEAPSRRSRILGTAGLVVTAAVAASLVVLPPATLTSATAGTRGLGTAVVTTSGGDAPATGPTSTYTVLDWATRLRQSTDIGTYDNQSADVTGFISPSPDDPDNSFFVTRFVVTCCAVDAQPVGVPVYDPGWSKDLKKNQWVRIRGSFATNPSTASSAPITLAPRTLTKIAQPRDPYLY